MAQVPRAEKLILLTNTRGLLDKAGNLLTGLTLEKVDALWQTEPSRAACCRRSAARSTR